MYDATASLDDVDIASRRFANHHEPSDTVIYSGRNQNSALHILCIYMSLVANEVYL